MMIKTWDFKDLYLDDEYQYEYYVNNWVDNNTSLNVITNH